MLMTGKLSVRRFIWLCGAGWLLLSGSALALDNAVRVDSNAVRVDSNAGRLDNDTGRQLWQESEQHRQRKAGVLDKAIADSEANILVVNGKKYRVENNPNDVGMALYLALMHQQWQDVRHYLALYQRLTGHDRQLVLFAQGELARHNGDLSTAEAKFRDILRQQPDFMLVKLELARVLFEGQQNGESLAMFKGLLAEHGDLPAELVKNIELFVTALKRRDSWHGSFSLAYSFNDNSNLSPNKPPQCLLRAANGLCVTERRLPLAQRSFGTVLNMTLSRRWQVHGHHGLLVRGLAYGENYPGRQGRNNSENLFSLALGYSFRDQHNELLIAPLYEYDNVSVHSRYQAAGISTEWTHGFPAKLTLSVAADYKQMYYQNGYENYNGSSSALYTTLYWSPDGRTTWFAGVDQLFKGAVHQSDRYRQSGLRVGVSRQITAGLEGILFTTLRHRRFAAYAPLYGDLRRDNEQFYSVQLKAPGWKLFTLTPSLTYRYRRNVSSLDWLYSYDKNEVLLKLERYF